MRITPYILLGLFCASCASDPLHHDRFEFEEDTWVYSNQLHKVISPATSLQVFDQGFTLFESTSRAAGTTNEADLVDIDLSLLGEPLSVPPPRMVEITSLTLLETIASNIVFQTEGNPLGPCVCEGDYTFKWLKDGKPLAVVTLHHDSHMRDRDSSILLGDALLTKDSRKWLIQWLNTIYLNEKKQRANKPDAGDGK